VSDELRHFFALNVT